MEFPSMLSFLLLLFYIACISNSNEIPGNSNIGDIQKLYWESKIEIPPPERITSNLLKTNYFTFSMNPNIRKPGPFDDLSFLCDSLKLECNLDDLSIEAIIEPLHNAGYKTSMHHMLKPLGNILNQNTTFTPSFRSTSHSKLLLNKAKFFLEETLLEKNITFIPTSLPIRSFLPRIAAEKIKPNSALITNMMKGLDSYTGQQYEQYINFVVENMCNSREQQRELSACVFSLEDLVDLAISAIGQAKVHMDDDVSGLKIPVSIGDPVLLSGANGFPKIMPCHDFFVPFGALICHLAEQVRVYKVPLVEKNEASVVAICHTNTSDWSPNHPAITSLNTMPGCTAICHWLDYNGMVWVPSEYPDITREGISIMEEYL